MLVKQFSPVTSAVQMMPSKGYSYVGGVLGYLGGYRSDDSTSNLVNRGHISVDENSVVANVRVYVGGAVGYVDRLGVSNLSNLGAVEAKGRVSEALSGKERLISVRTSIRDL